MSISLQNNSNTSLELGFINYEKETESHHHLSLTFSILQSEIVLNNYSFIRSIIYNESYLQSEQQNNSVPVFSNEIDSILHEYSQQQSISEINQQSIITNLDFSLFDKVDPAIIPQLKAGIPPNSITSLYKQVNSLSPVALGDIVANQQVLNINPRNLILDLMSKYKIDPSNIMNQKEDPMNMVSNLRNYYINELTKNINSDSNYYVQQKKVQLKDKIYLKMPFSIQKFSSVGSLKIVLSLYKSGDNNPVLYTGKSFSIEDLQPLYNQIKKNPSVGFANHNLFITQEDERSNNIVVYKKTISSNGGSTGYQKIFDEMLLPKKQKFFYNEVKTNHLDVFRVKCTSVPTTVTNNSFKNLIVGNLNQFDGSALIVNDNLVSNNSVTLEVRNIPDFVSQVAIGRRRRIVSDSFSPETIVIPYTSISQDIFTSQDDFIQPGSIYEYTVHYKTRGGTTKKSVSQQHSYVGSAVNLGISTEITEVQASFQGNPQISFTVTTTAIQNQATKIKKLLQSLGIDQEFVNSSIQNQSQFDQLFHHKVIRTNLSTGAKEIFEDIDQTGSESVGISFVDSMSTRQLFSIDTPRPNVGYRYDIRVFARDPSTLYPAQVKTLNLQGDINRTVHYRPYKWNQPEVFSSSTLLAQNNSGVFIGRSLNDFGELGTTAFTIVNSTPAALSVKNLTCLRLDLKTVKVFWNIVGETSYYDHFVVIKECNKKKEIVATTTEPEFFYQLNRSDRGTIIFYIIPVFDDYSVGTAERTNSIIVNPEEMDAFITE